MPAFADRLASAIREKGAPVVVGLDPRWDNLPSQIRNMSDGSHSRIAKCYEAFCRDVIDAVANHVAVVKPQAAFFEELGPAGMSVLHRVIEYAHRKNLMVILDGKRNDIGSTATAYAKAYLGQDSSWGADALTVSPYLGDDSLTPFVETAAAKDAGVFVLVKTSNPGGTTFQDLECSGSTIYQRAASLVERFACQNLGHCDYGCVGAVVGATYPDQLKQLRDTMRHAWFLVPGFGRQGGTARDVAGAFDDNGLGAVINSSRSIIFAYERREYESLAGNWQMAVEQATTDMISELRSDTRAGLLHAKAAS